MKKFITLLFISTIFSTQAQFRVNLIARLPASVPGDSVYVAGNFNGWNPALPQFLLTRNNNNGTVSFTVKENHLIEFKITRGNWNLVETDANGRDVENRVFKIESDTTFYISVAAWKDQFAGIPQKSTASANVQIISTSFTIPQLNTKRTVRIYLPPGYTAGKKRYPVLYMHDGQNLFDEALNPFGEWGVDEYLDSARKTCIVVATDHGANKRMNEYNPYNNERFGKGEGKAYCAFLVQTLKPYIDKQFRTLPGRNNTFIAGSSMGGLISFYAALQYPKIFGRAGILSPAFWINYKEVETEIKKARKRTGQHFLFYAGQMESETLAQEVIGIFNLLNRQLPGNPIMFSLKANGKHNEQSWRRILPEFFGWLL